jgi:hypothetical protein
VYKSIASLEIDFDKTRRNNHSGTMANFPISLVIIIHLQYAHCLLNSVAALVRSQPPSYAMAQPNRIALVRPPMAFIA